MVGYFIIFKTFQITCEQRYLKDVSKIICKIKPTQLEFRLTAEQKLEFIMMYFS